MNKTACQAWSSTESLVRQAWSSTESLVRLVVYSTFQ